MHEPRKVSQLGHYTSEELAAWADAQSDELFFEVLSGPKIPCASPYRVVGGRKSHTSSGIERFKVDMQEHGSVQ